ncbi:MAG: ABC transporter ATP-binding protein [Pseudomonadota bacterium]|nr:ABC transporter ATP-binding protein [Pseudomonadota bacterium]
MISLESVDFSLAGPAGKVDILRQVSLKAGEGEALAIVGPSGSGKTSLLMLIAGLEAPTSGRVCVAQENLAAKSEDELALFRARHIGIVFQSFHLISTMTALENVAIPLEFTGHADARQRAAEALAALGLSHRLHHYPAQLSGGEQQRVAIARAFVAQPKLLLADEPTGNLDIDTGQQVIDLLFSQHRAQGTTLLLITHDAQLAGRCDRVIHLADGRIIPSPLEGEG